MILSNSDVAFLCMIDAWQLKILYLPSLGTDEADEGAASTRISSNTRKLANILIPEDKHQENSQAMIIGYVHKKTIRKMTQAHLNIEFSSFLKSQVKYWGISF